MITETDRSYMKDAFAQLRDPVRLVVFTSALGCASCQAAVETAKAIRTQSPRIGLEPYDLTMDRDKTDQYGVQRAPCIIVQGGDGRPIKFYGTPKDVFFRVLVDCIAAVSTGKDWFPEEVRAPLAMLTSDVSIQVFVENGCEACRPVAETAIGLGLSSNYIYADVVIAEDFPDLMKKHLIGSLTKTVFGGNLHLDGHVTEILFLEMIFQAEGLKPGLGKHCVVCGNPSSDVICTTCKTKIQAEAVDHKLRSEKLGKSDSRRS
ncbi:MAG TPA: hypothetical protein DCS42_11160 [Nitrospiraceae bacterium]|nr:hypothetical protein [Nitrospiraceae bacterium]